MSIYASIYITLDEVKDSTASTVSRTPNTTAAVSTSFINYTGTSAMLSIFGRAGATHTVNTAGFVYMMYT